MSLQCVHCHTILATDEPVNTFSLLYTTTYTHCSLIYTCPSLIHTPLPYTNIPLTDIYTVSTVISGHHHLTLLAMFNYVTVDFVMAIAISAMLKNSDWLIDWTNNRICFVATITGKLSQAKPISDSSKNGLKMTVKISVLLMFVISLLHSLRT